MAENIPEISISDFKRLRVHELRRLKSCEVFADGVYLFTFINPYTDYIRLQTEGFAFLSNTQGGEDMESILQKEAA